VSASGRIGRELKGFDASVNSKVAMSSRPAIHPSTSNARVRRLAGLNAVFGSGSSAGVMPQVFPGGTPVDLTVSDGRRLMIGFIHSSLLSRTERQSPSHVQCGGCYKESLRFQVRRWNALHESCRRAS